MISVGRKMEYALMILKVMSEREFSSARELSDELRIPFDTASKVMQRLTNAAVVESVQGAKGGYRLKSQLSELSYYQINQIIEDKSPLVKCEGPKGKCEYLGHCNIVSPIHRLNELTVGFYQDVMLDQLLSIQPNSNTQTRKHS